MRKILSLALVAAVAAVLASSAAAGGGGGMTAQFGTPDLASRVLITVPFTVSCYPFDPSLTLFQETANVTVEQAAGTAIAHGATYYWGQPTLFSCDGTDQTYALNVMADPTGPPFHGGPAVFTAYVQADAGIPCGWPGCYDSVVSVFANLGPTTLNMH